MDRFKFLFFLYAFPPMAGTAPKRNYRIASFISKRAKFSKIFTSIASTPEIQSQGMNIISLPVFDYRSLLRKRTADGAVPENKKTAAVTQFFIRLMNTFPVNIIAGEGGLVYFINLLRRGGKSIRQDGITHLYSSYRPFADHYAAYLLKKRYPQVYWIADFRDLIIDPHYNHILFSKRHHSFFKKIFSHANLLTTVSDGLAKHLQAYNANVITLRNGVPDDLKTPMPIPSKKFTLAYTGSMFLDKRNAEPVFKALQELFRETKIEADDIQIIYAGKDGQYWQKMAARYHFERLLTDKGIVSGDEAKRIQQQACINILLSISSDALQGVVTGKMIEYVEAGSPVLGIIRHRLDEELKEMLEELNIGSCYTDSEESMTEIINFIWKEYEYWKRSGMNRKPVNDDQLKKAYSMNWVMKPLFDALHIESIA